MMSAVLNELAADAYGAAVLNPSCIQNETVCARSDRTFLLGPAVKAA
jgi:hypothetical protein